MRLRLAPAVILLPAVTGCISISSFQTARTQREGEVSTFVGLGYESLVFPRKSDDESTSDLQSDIEEIKVPIIETGLRYGLCGNCDIGLRITLPGTIAGDFKYQLSGSDSSVATAIGIGAGYGTYDTGGDKFKSEYRILDVFVPFFISKDLSDTLSIYGSPRFMMRTSTSTFTSTTTDAQGVETTEVDEESDSGNFFGATVGFSFYWFVAEAGYFFAPGEQANAGITQVMIGYWGGWDEVNKPRAAAKEPAEERRPGRGSKKKKGKKG